MPSLNQTHRVPVRISADVAASNYFAAPVNVFDHSGEQAHIYSLDVDVNGFTNGALLTATILYKVGSTLTARQYQTQTTKGAADTLWRIIDGSSLVPGNANALRVTVQSDNAGDVAVAVPVSYFLETS